jgi:hypothetical protein
LRNVFPINGENSLLRKILLLMIFSNIRNIYLISWQTFLTEKYSLQLWNIFPFETYFYQFLGKFTS